MGDVDATIPAWFIVQMQRMADLRFPPSALRMHWDGLSTVPEAVLEAAVTRAIMTRTTFPTPVELRQDADLAGVRPTWTPPAGTALPEPLELGTLPTGTRIVARRQAPYACDECRDTGWASADDDPRTVWRCGCWATNPVLRRKREALARYADQAATK